MVDGEEKYVYIKCHEIFGINCFWVLDCFEEWEEEHTYWLSPEDYEFYSLIGLREKIIESLKNREKRKLKNKIRRMKIDEDTLRKQGYIQIETKEGNWGFDWIVQEVGWWDLRKFFSNKEGIHKRIAFYEFGRQLYLKKQLELVWTWLQIDLVVKWCEENQIPYRLDISPEFSVEVKDQAIGEIKERVRQWSGDNRFTGELQVLNRNDLGRKLQ